MVSAALASCREVQRNDAVAGRTGAAGCEWLEGTTLEGSGRAAPKVQVELRQGQRPKLPSISRACRVGSSKQLIECLFCTLEVRAPSLGPYPSFLHWSDEKYGPLLVQGIQWVYKDYTNLGSIQKARGFGLRLMTRTQPSSLGIQAFLQGFK